MRICIRCGTEMKEGYSLQISNLTAMGVLQLVEGKSVFSSKILGRVKTAVCPKCGEISLYFEDIDEL